MPDASHFGRTAGALFVLALPLLTGCAKHADVAAFDEDRGAYSGMVSAREYGFVRPAGARAGTSGSYRGMRTARIPAGGDPWGRVRSGMQLNLHADSRIEVTLARFRRDPRYLEKMSRQASPYLPIIVAEIERRGFPMELALLPHVESRYNPAATSPKAAGGMWQFMPYTAREMGLRLDDNYDERRDVVASTRAAMNYLEQLNRRFDGDWELAMAAYNCGPGRVEAARAVNRRSGRPTDFWSLDLPQETRQYVPQILATARLVADSRNSGSTFPSRSDNRPDNRSERGRVAVRLHQRSPSVADGRIYKVANGDSLATIALRHNLDRAYLAEWNGLSPRDPLLPGQTLRIPNAETPAETTRLVMHRVSKNDSIETIARRYGVTIAEIRRWNDVADNRLKQGETLRIYRREARLDS